MQKFFEQMDWAELRSHKEWLDKCCCDEADRIIGLLNYIQDCGIEEFGVEAEELIYGPEFPTEIHN